MRDPKRISEILAELERVMSKYNDLRFGQLIEICYNRHLHQKNLPVDYDVFNFEDDKLLEMLKEL